MFAAVRLDTSFFKHHRPSLEFALANRSHNHGVVVVSPASKHHQMHHVARARRVSRIIQANSLLATSFLAEICKLIL